MAAMFQALEAFITLAFIFCIGGITLVALGAIAIRTFRYLGDWAFASLEKPNNE